MKTVAPVGASAGSHLARDVIEHARVDAVNRPVRPGGEVGVRREVELVPSAALEAGAAMSERDESELTAPGVHVTA